MSRGSPCGALYSLLLSLCHRKMMTLTKFLRLSQHPQLGIPIGLERIGYEPIVWVHQQISPHERLPFFLRHTFYDAVTVHRLTIMSSPINEGTRISRVVEDAQNTAMFQTGPRSITSLPSAL